MFVDSVKITVKSGDGGDGAISFHREKYIANGGPDGGDGGKGGDIVFQMDNNLSTLSNFRYKKRFIAQNGQSGGKNNMSGKSAESVVIKVPKGTIISDFNTGKLLADISSEGNVTLLKGGKGGFGNAHFATPVRQAPRFAKPGECGLELELQLELKLLADVGLVGFPNVGKSTLISVVSEAKPKIANYHFTTLSPVLGVIRHKGTSFVMADIPGLIEGAHNGLGLGDAFLKHVERCRLLLHIVDVSGTEGRDPAEDLKTINNELKKFNKKLLSKPMLVVGSKCDLAQKEKIKSFKKYAESLGYVFLPISSATKEGISKLLDILIEKLNNTEPLDAPESFEVLGLDQLREAKEKEFKILKSDETYEVISTWLSKIVNMLDFEDDESLIYLKNILNKYGVNSELRKSGAKIGSTVKLGNFYFEFIE